jgi:thymidylate kinase
MMVGIMGGDGSGKSTALVALGDWLGPEFDVRLVHLGKPRWSVTTIAVRASLKVAALGASGLQRLVPVAPTRRLAVLVSTYRPLFWLLCTARDRQYAYRDARRYAINGELVLCDRYPHPRLRSMEAPLIASRTAGRPDNRLVRAMIRREQRYHHSIAPPELLVVLRVDPEIAVQRKTEESPDSVRARGAEVWNIDWRDSRAHVIDASQTEEAVAGELKALVWSTLA